MLSRAVWGLTLALVLPLVVAGVGCKKDKKPKANTVEAPARPMSPPGPVMVYLGLRNPSRTLDDTLALMNEFVPLPLTRSGLLDLFAQRASLPREMIDAVDIGKPLWLVGLDERQVEADPDPLVMVLPLRSRQSFEQGLAKKLMKSGTEGRLTVYKPKPGAVGTHPVKLVITDTHVWTGTSAKAFEIAEPFIRGTLLPRTLDHDLAVHFVVENILKVRGDDLDRKVDQAMDQVRNSVQRSSSMDRQQVAGATENTVRRWLEALKSTREVQLTVDANREQLTAALHGLAQKQGRLAQLIRRQRSAPPVGYRRLPASSWMVFADHGNKEAQAEDRKTWEPLLGQMLKGMAPGKQDEVIAAVSETMALFTGDYTVALHRAPTGSGLTCSMVARVSDAGQAFKSLNRLESAIGVWIKAMLARSKERVPDGTRVERRAFSQGKAKGALFQLQLQLPPDKRTQVERVLGVPIALGVAFVGEHALLSLGKGAEEQLKTLVAGTDPGQVENGLAKNPAFERARTMGTERVGLVYLSLVDLLRWFEGTGMKELETIAAALKEHKVTAAPSLDWGVNKERTGLDITLRLPAAHFRAFKPILKELQQRGGLRGLLGGQRASWREP